MSCDFSYQHYRAILKAALNQGFVLTCFRDLPQHQQKPKIIILRHDVDYSPKRALAIAKVERALKIKSTFFVRVHGEYYHPFHRLFFPYFKEIMAMGHEIGLHTEARHLAKEFKLNLATLFLREKKILEGILDLKVISASEHADLGRPRSYWQKHFFDLIDKKKVGIKHYPQEYADFTYIGDSCGRWRKGCLCQHLEKSNKIQALIHPDHWGKNASSEIKKMISNNPLVKRKDIEF